MERADNGLEVHLLPTRETRGSLCLLSLENPLSGDREAHALLPDLLTRGTAQTPGLAEMAARCEALFETDLVASVTAAGPNQLLRFGFEVLADRFAGGVRVFDQAVELLAETLHQPALEAGRLRSDHLLQERDNLVRSIAGLRDDYGLLAWRRLVESMHAGTPWALHSWGDQDSAAALDEARVHAAWDRARGQLAGRLVLVGDLSMEQALEAAAKLGGDSQRPAPAAPRLPPAVSDAAAASGVGAAANGAQAGGVREGHDRLPLRQSQLVLGFAMEHEAMAGPSAALMAAVFGGGSHSRLFKRVREAEGLAYGCGGSLLVDSATLVVQAGIDGDQAARVRELVLAELSSLALDGPRQDELDVARRALQRRLDAIMDSPRELMGWRLFALATGRETHPERASRLLSEVQPEDVARAAGAVSLHSAYLLEGTSK
ncbi:MAG: hypothetical protein DRQ55_02655 [Planctomycetota bacterium]|nr:MAG: hypothetical protein DRQ55_02655 [Planctomycetota bacterium]